jgi:class 3 adenylate cyclase
MAATLAEPSGEGSGAHSAAEDRVEAPPDSLTRGFLFADLRDYTRYVESHGAASAADLLVRYRALVRTAVARYRGAEIKTEGDSFYVIFPAVSAAVQCGLAITAGAREAATARGPAEDEIKVGVGIHAGETVETPEGFVGSAVNIAARVCAIAGPGQVLVSETVRALTQGVVPVSFTPLGRRQLKGVKEPLMLYAVARADPAAEARAAMRHRSKRLAGWLAVAAILAILTAAALWWQARPAAGLPPGRWTIGVQVRQPQLNGVKLAVDAANAAGGIGGSLLDLDVRDEGPDSEENDASAAATAFAADPRVIAMVGPSGSVHATVDIPITNNAGLLECSPENTSPGLTKPRFGALDLRSAFPERINYVRLATSDDIQGPAAASYVFNDLQYQQFRKVRQVLVIDDTAGGREVADSFQRAFESYGGAVAAAGGTVFRRALNPGTTDFTSVLDPLNGYLQDAGPAVYFGGYTDTRGAELKEALSSTGTGLVPFLSWEGIWDGSGTDDGSFIQLAGADAANSYATRPSVAPARPDFDARYRAAFGQAPDEFSGAAFACTQVILEALRKVAETGPGAAQLREAVRAYAVDPAHRYETVLGSVAFDANGDSLQQFVTFYKVDMGANGGKGDWITVKQQDFGPAT